MDCYQNCVDFDIQSNENSLGRGDKLRYVQPPTEDSKFPTVSVIVTICSGSSYDNLFLAKPQKAPEGKVSLFVLDPQFSGEVLNALQGKKIENSDSTFEKMLELLVSEIKLVNAESVLFNWECCSGFSQNIKSLVQKNDNMKLMKFLLDNKNMIMCSDFAVEALINDWDVELLGENPFKKLGECHSSMELSFIPSELKECSSIQLQLVGQLCEKGSLVIHALSGTIVFGLKEEKKTYSNYTLTLLTIATKTDNRTLFSNCEIAAQRGSIGHVMLTYKSGGCMLLSAGHWIEMTKFDVDQKNLENVVQDFGGEYVEQWNSINNNDNYNYDQKYEMNQRLANDMIQKSAPCGYSNNVNFKKTYKK